MIKLIACHGFWPWHALTEGSTLVNHLPNNELNVQVSDTTGDEP